MLGVSTFLLQAAELLKKLISTTGDPLSGVALDVAESNSRAIEALGCRHRNGSVMIESCKGIWTCEHYTKRSSLFVPPFNDGVEGGLLTYLETKFLQYIYLTRAPVLFPGLLASIGSVSEIECSHAKCRFKELF